jgi:hypothetical protein
MSPQPITPMFRRAMPERSSLPERDESTGVRGIDRRGIAV